jgi:hypothetical protein
MKAFDQEPDAATRCWRALALRRSDVRIDFVPTLLEAAKSAGRSDPWFSSMIEIAISQTAGIADFALGEESLASLGALEGALDSPSTGEERRMAAQLLFNLGVSEGAASFYPPGSAPAPSCARRSKSFATSRARRRSRPRSTMSSPDRATETAAQTAAPEAQATISLKTFPPVSVSLRRRPAWW